MVTIASMTSSPEELEHAAGPNWREPFVPKEVPKESEASEPEAKKEADSEPAKEESKPKHKGGWQKSIDRATAQRNAAQARADKLEAELTELRAKYETPAQPEDQPPQLKDYKTPEEWADARDAWKAVQAEKQEKAEEVQRTVDAYNKATEEARAKHEDWEDVVSADIMIPLTVHNAILELGKEGPEVAYYLGQHPEFCEELMSMKPLAAVVRIGKIADALKSTSSPEKKEKQQKPKPPEPIATVGASSARSNVPLDQLDPKDYIKVMNKRERERRF